MGNTCLKIILEIVVLHCVVWVLSIGIKDNSKNAITELQKAIASNPNVDDAKKLLKQPTHKKSNGLKAPGILKNKKKPRSKTKSNLILKIAIGHG